MAATEAITTTKLKQFLSGPAPTKDMYLRAPDGLGVRRFKGSGKASFIVEAKIRGQGKARRITIGPAEPELLTEAKDKARVIVARLRSGEDVTATQRDAHKKKVSQRVTVQSALEHMLDKRTDLKPSTQRDYRSTITHNAGLLFSTRITDLSIENIRKQLQRVEREKSTASAAKLRRSLSAVISFSITEYALPMSNPMERIKGVAKAVKVRQGFVPDNRVGSLITQLYALREHHATHGNYLLFVLATGCRKEEAMKLEWSDVDWKQLSVTFRNTKNHRDHTLPISCWMDTILRDQFRQRKGNSSWVFPGRINGTRLTDVRKTIINHLSKDLLWTPRDEAGRELQLHDLRRTAATHMEGAGIPKERVSLILNHKGGDITDRYIQQNFKSILASLEDYHVWLIRQTKDLSSHGQRVREELLPGNCAQALRGFGVDLHAEVTGEVIKESKDRNVIAPDYWRQREAIERQQTNGTELFQTKPTKQNNSR